MKKIQIEVDDETYAELLKRQLELTLANGGVKVSLAKVISYFLKKNLVHEKSEK